MANHTNPITGEEYEVAEDEFREAAFRLTDLAVMTGFSLQEVISAVIDQYALSISDKRADISTFKGAGNPHVHPAPNWLCDNQTYRGR
jgi:hypothetical protein